MSENSYVVVLEECPAEKQQDVAALLSKAFGIKVQTSETVVESAPIIILGELMEMEAAAVMLMLSAVTKAGCKLVITDKLDTELPKIDWPKQPLLFKRSISGLPDELDIDLPIGTGQQVNLVELLVNGLKADLGRPINRLLPDPATNASGGVPTQDEHVPSTDPYVDAPMNMTPPVQHLITDSHSRQAFERAELGEITPFSNPILPTIASETSSINSGEVSNRMDELFPDEGENIVPQSNDVTSIIDKLLPDDDDGQSLTSSWVKAQGGFSVFLAKINDAGRQDKAVPLLQEISGIGEDEARTLVKKMIIPVVKGVTKEEAEATKHRFAEIGILARIRN